MSFFELRNISKTYGEGDRSVRALVNVNLKIERGDFISIVGPSGSGKSTLMHVIGLLDIPTSGKLLIDNKDVSNLAESELAKLRNKTIGFVFQQFNLLERTTAFENVLLPLVYSEVEEKKRFDMAKNVLSLVGLEGRLRHYPNQLSGGQQQRVAIARALVNNPQVILADEPTGNLDTKTGREILDIFKSLNNSGKTIILVTHDQTLSRKAKKRIELEDGKIKIRK